MKCEVCETPHNNKRFCSVKCRMQVTQALAVESKRRNKHVIECLMCKIQFTPGSRARKYCSRKCYHASERTPDIGVCKLCKKEFPLFQPSGKKTKREFCTRTCSGRYVQANRKTPMPKWSEERRSRQIPNMRRGENHPFWRGGITPIQKVERRKPEYIAWRKAVFERDDYTCQICHVRGGELNADHIRSWIKYPGLRTDVDNGRTLCVSCHRKTPTYARNLKYQI